MRVSYTRACPRRQYLHRERTPYLREANLHANIPTPCRHGQCRLRNPLPRMASPCSHNQLRSRHAGRRIKAARLQTHSARHNTVGNLESRCAVYQRRTPEMPHSLSLLLPVERTWAPVLKASCKLCHPHCSLLFSTREGEREQLGAYQRPTTARHIQHPQYLRT